MIFADRQPVLKQIDLPHAYYFREMYLPQLTTGPSSAAWTPDGKAVVYSLGGSLWRQRIDSGLAQQLTSGPGYDYQPDVSHDGRWIVYASYADNAIDLHVLDLQTGQSRALTSGGNVNLSRDFHPTASAWFLFQPHTTSGSTSLPVISLTANSRTFSGSPERLAARFRVTTTANSTPKSVPRGPPTARKSFSFLIAATSTVAADFGA